MYDEVSNMSNLYRVVASKTWEDAKRSGSVPRCGNDKEANGVHLNVVDAVETIASMYFEPDELPIVLEVDVSNFSSRIEWKPPSTPSGWKQPLAKISNLPVSSVVQVHKMRHTRQNGKNVYKLERST